MLYASASTCLSTNIGAAHGHAQQGRSTLLWAVHRLFVGTTALFFYLPMSTDPPGHNSLTPHPADRSVSLGALTSVAFCGRLQSPSFQETRGVLMAEHWHPSWGDWVHKLCLRLFTNIGRRTKRSPGGCVADFQWWILRRMELTTVSRSPVLLVLSRHW